MRHYAKALVVAIGILIAGVLPAAAVEYYNYGLTFRYSANGFSSGDVALTVAADGTVWFADPGMNVIGKVINGQPVVIAGQQGVAGTADGVGTAAMFDRPNGVAIDAGGNLFIVESGSCRIRKMAPDGTVTAFAGRTYGFGNADGGPTVATFWEPSAIAIDPSGTLYVTDSGNNKIRRITSSGTVSTLAGANVSGRVDATGTAARFYRPLDLAYRNGVLYIADWGNNSVRRIDVATANVSTVAGYALAYETDGSGATFGKVSGVAVTPDGTLFIADPDLNTIRRINPDGWVTTAGGSFRYQGDREGTSYDARFNSPRRVAALGNDDILVTDSGRIKHGTPKIGDTAKIDTTSAMTTIARQLSVLSMSATQFQWSMTHVPAGSVAALSSTSISNPTFTPDLPGWYELRLDATSAAGTSITYVNLDAWCNFPAPVIRLDSADVCRGGTNRATIDQSLVYYNWFVQNGTIESGAGTNSIVFRATTANPVTVSLSAGDSQGCTTYVAKNVPIRAAAGPAIHLNPATFCTVGAGSTASVDPIYASYAWSISGGTFTTATNASSAGFKGNGNSPVFLSITVTDAGGCISTTTNYVAFPRQPVGAMVQYTPAQLCQNGTAGTATVTNASSFQSYQWSITNGVFTTPADGVSVSYRATTANTVQLVLWATDTTGCISMTGYNVPIRTIAAPAVTASGPLTFCNGGSVTLTAPAGYSYTWSNGATTQSTTVSTSGSYTVTITDAGGCTATSAAKTVTSTNPPAPPSIAFDSATVCASSTSGASVPAGFASYQWSVTGGTASGAANAAHFNYVADASGNVTLTVVVTDANGCSATNSLTAPIHTIDAPTIHATPLAICPNGSPAIATVDNPSSYASFQWSVANGTIEGSSTSSNVAFHANGTQPLMLTLDVTDFSGCTARASTTIEIRTLEPPTIRATPMAICPNGSPAIAAVDNPFNYALFQWSVANGTIEGSSTSSNVAFHATGTQPVLLTLDVTDFGGCTARSSMTIEIRTLEPPTIRATPLAICPNGSPAIATVDSPFNYASFQWSVANGTIEGSSVGSNVAFHANGTAPVLLTVDVTDFGGCTARSNITIDIRTLAPPTIHATPLAICPNGSPAIAAVDNPFNYAAFQWSVANGTIEGSSTSSNVAFRATGTAPVLLTVDVTDFGGCTARSDTTVGIRTLDPPVIHAAPLAICPNGAPGTAAVDNPMNYASFLWSAANATIEGSSTSSNVAFRASGTAPVLLTVDVTDFGGCTARADTTVSIRTLDPPVIHAAPLAICPNGSPGTAAVDNPMNYASFLWSAANATIEGSSTSSNVAFRATGTAPVLLTVDVTDFGGCAARADTTVSIRTLDPPIIHTTPLAICPNGAPGTATVDNPSNYASFLWSAANATIEGSSTSSNVAFRATGTAPVLLTVDVTDFGGCTARADTTVGIRTLDPPTIRPTQPAICAAGSGSAGIDNPSLYASYLWSASNAIIEGSSDGAGVAFRATGSDPVTLTVDVIDFGGCTARSTVTIPIASPPDSTITVGNSYAFRDGIAAATVADLTNTYHYCQNISANLGAPIGAGYTYQWSTGSSQRSIAVSSPGTYSVTVTNAAGCSSTSSVTLVLHTIPAAPSIAASSLTLCPTGGSVTLTASDAEGWLWSNGATTRSIVVTTPGSYSVRATNVSCASQPSQPIDITTATASISASATSFCPGGSATLTASPGASYQWSTGATTRSIVVTTADTFTVTVTSADGCSITAPAVTTTISSLAVAITPSASTRSCSSAPVTMQATPSGGSGSYSYQWFGASGPISGATSSSYTVALPGSDRYHVSVSDSAACTVVSSETIVTIDATPVADLSTYPSGCVNSMLFAQARGTGSSDTIDWSVTNATIDGDSHGVVLRYLPTAPGEVVVTLNVHSPNGCNATATATVPIHDVPDATITADGPTTFCPGGSVTLSAPAGGGQYHWSTGESTRSVVARFGGMYTVTVYSSDNQCNTISQPFAVTLLPPPDAQITASSTTICPGGSVTLSAPSGVTPAWYRDGALLSSQPSLSVTSAGTYELRTTANGCANASTIDIALDNSLNGTISGTNLVCWQNAGGSYQYNGTAAGYAWTVTNGTIASGQGTSAITFAPAAGASSVHIALVATSAAGCTRLFESDVTVTKPLTTITAGGPTTFCAGNSVTLTASGNYASYVWSNGQSGASLVVTQAGTYSVHAVTNGCAGPESSPVTVTTIAQPSAVVSGSTAICAAGAASITATLTGSAPFAITWSDGVTVSGINTSSVTRSVSPSSNTTYTITSLTDANCSGTSTGSAVVTVNVHPTGVVSGNAAICAGGSASITATLSGSAPFAITWSDGVTVSGINTSSVTRSVSPSSNTTYTITSITDANCSGTSTGSAAITVNAKPTAVVSGSAAICAGGNASITATLTGSAPFAITWSDGVTVSGINTTSVTRSVAPSSNTTYTITSVSDANCGGTASGSAVITVNQKPTATVSGSATICAGGAASITATLAGVAPFTIVWSDGVTQNGINTTSATRSVSPSSNTTYTITSITDVNCSGTASGSAAITVNAKPTAAVSGSAAICAGSSITISATLSGSAPFAITWSDGVTQSGINTTSVTRSVSPSSNTTYTITSVSDANCSGTSTGIAAITVNAKPTAVVSGNAAICAGGSTTISATLTGSAPFAITWSDGVAQTGINTSSVTRSVAPSSNTTYTITSITDANCSGTSTGSAAITVNAKPTAVVSGSAAICAGSSTTISATLSGGAPFAITWSDGVTQNGINTSSATRSVSPSSNTTYTITSVTDANCSGTSTGSAAITVNAKPTAVVSGSAAICAGSSTTISATLTGVAPFTIIWSDGVTQSNVNTSSVTRSVSPSSNATYTITSITDTNCSGTSTGSAAITIKARPTATVSGNSSGCPSTARTITATLTGAAPFSITWSDGVVQSGISTSTATRSVSPAATTTYTITAVSDSGCTGGTSSGSAVVTVTPVPSITQQPSNITTTRNTTITFHVVAAPAGVQYRWQTLSGSTWSNATGTGATTADYSTSQSRKGTYQYRVIVSDVCTPSRSVTSNAVTLTVN
jgi:hypothetical protein